MYIIINNKCIRRKHLFQAIERLEKADKQIKELEHEYGIPNDDFAELNYSLVRVVYEWTSQKVC